MTDPADRSESNTATSDENGEFQQHVRDYSRAAGRWMSASLTRDSLTAGLKTLIWLVPLTVLIWVYAEREQTITTSPETIPFRITSSDPNRKVDPLMEGSSVIVKLNGPQSSIEEIRKDVQLLPSGEPSVVITIPSGTSTGVQELDMAQLLSRSKQFAASGVTIVSCQPEKLKVDVDEIVEREAEVQATPDMQKNLVAQQTSFTPATVMVRAPSRSFPKDVKLEVYADLSKAPDINQPGERKGDVPLIAPQWKDAQITVSNVRFSLEVRPSEKQYTIKTMSIRQISRVNLLSGFNVICELQLTDVPVSGPPDQIDQLEKVTNDPQTTDPPAALLNILQKDVPNRKGSTRLEFRFPKGAEGVHVVQTYEYVQKDFEFTLVPIQP